MWPCSCWFPFKQRNKQLYECFPVGLLLGNRTLGNDSQSSGDASTRLRKLLDFTLLGRPLREFDVASRDCLATEYPFGNPSPKGVSKQGVSLVGFPLSNHKKGTNARSAPLVLPFFPPLSQLNSLICFFRFPQTTLSPGISEFLLGTRADGSRTRPSLSRWERQFASGAHASLLAWFG